MVLRLKKCPGFFPNYAKCINDNGKGTILYNQMKHLSEMAPVPKKLGFFREKLEEIVRWYDEFTGMDEVREAQKRVLEDEQKFKLSQEKRRHILDDLNNIKDSISDLHGELENTTRGDQRYLNLVTQEHKLLKEERHILEKFKMAEEVERNSFAALSSSVKLSHEKERAQSERTKYWSIIGSVMGTVLGILGTSINNHFKMNELKELIRDSSDKILIDSLKEYLESNEKLFEKLKSNEKALVQCNHNGNGNGNNAQIWNNLNKKLISMESSLKKIEDINFHTVNNNNNNENDYVSSVAVDTLAIQMKKDYAHTKMLLITIAVLSILMPFITKYT